MESKAYSGTGGSQLNTYFLKDRGESRKISTLMGIVDNTVDFGYNTLAYND